MQAIVLAGGTWQEQGQEGIKALYPLKGKPMIHYVLEALATVEAIDGILVVGNQKALSPHLPQGIFCLQEGPSLMDNVVLGIHALGKGEPILLVTGDIPLIKGNHVVELIEDWKAHPVDFLFPIAEKRLCLAEFPRLKRTFGALKEGIFTGGNVLVIRPEALLKLEDLARRVIQHRKDPLKLCQLLGPGLLLRYLSKSLTLAQLEAYALRRFHLHGRAYICKTSALCQDLDRVEEAPIMEDYLGLEEHHHTIP